MAFSNVTTTDPKPFQNAVLGWISPFTFIYYVRKDIIVMYKPILVLIWEMYVAIIVKIHLF